MRRRLVAAVCVVAGLACARAGRADDGDAHPWVRRPIVLEPWSARFDYGAASTRSDVGTSFEAVVGLPILLELGVRVGDRPSDGARATNADFHARLFDHESANLGGSAVSNPEIRARLSALDFGDVAVALEARLVLPRAAGTHVTISPGIPVRVRIARLARIDTGVYLPVRASADEKYTFDAPVDLWMQAGNFFFGPMTGVRASKNRFDVPAGIGAGITFLGALDLKAQAYTLRINDADWSHSLGFGVGLGVTTP